MNRIFALLFLVGTSISAALQPAAAVTIDWRTVGNPGNPADTVLMTDGTTGYGSVPYSYKIGAYDVTNSQYVEFLNTKDPTGANTLGLWNSDMADPAEFGGNILFSPADANGGKYTPVPGAKNHPVNYVTWYSAVRFANWLNNGQGNGDTESGAYTLLHDGSPIPTPVPSNNGPSIIRNAGAKVFLPSEDEWYKAAYYDPSTRSYFRYPTSSNTTPIASSPTDLANHANFNAAVDNLTDVGAYTGTTSPYGAFDMGGNVYQWNEALVLGYYRGLRGATFGSFSDILPSSYRSIYGGDPTGAGLDVGFRVASVPEPSTCVLAIVAIGVVWLWRARCNM